ncbi:MAG: hypothetical protein ACLTGT_06135 [Oscillospiraceae bacterium]
MRADGAGGDADGHLPGYCRRDGAVAAGGAQRDGGYYATVNDDDTIYLLPAAPAEALAALAANGLNG